MKKHVVLLSEEAELDIVDIFDHVSTRGSLERALELVGRLQETCASLATLAHRGHVPAELERIGVTSCREIHLHSYRIVYGVRGAEVIVHAILDGRRGDLAAQLERRLLR